MRRYFIIGTDTNCGKTYATCRLLTYLNQQQYKAQAIKPIASGCIEQNGQLINEDIIKLQEHNYNPNQAINCWRYKEAIAPHLAAKNNADLISALDILYFCETKQFRTFDYLLIEGAGGLLVPLNEKETWLDFLQLSKIPVILVVGMRLGCINHALLTDYVLRTNNISCVGWIANCLHPGMLALDENIASLSSRIHMPLLTILPYSGKICGKILDTMLNI